MDRSSLVPALQNIATRLRIDSVRATSQAGSGHPTSCCSAADLVAALFFAEMRFDPKEPEDMDQPRILMCPADYFGIEYEINPWMNRAVATDPTLSLRQWKGLHDVLRDLGVEIVHEHP